MAKGFCTCKRDHPGNVLCHPPEGANWHYLCDKPVLPPAPGEPRPRDIRTQLTEADWALLHMMHGSYWGPDAMIVLPSGLKLSGNQMANLLVTDPPEYEPDDGEAQRIAEVYADAKAELDRGL